MRLFSFSQRLRGSRPAPATVISIIALVIALGGSAVAATAVIIKSSSQIAPGVVNSSDIANGQVKNSDLGAGSVTASKIAKGAVNTNSMSSATRQAIAGAGTSAREVVRRDGPLGRGAGEVARVATMTDLGPGNFVVLAKAVLTPDRDTGNLLDQGKTINGHCRLDVNGETDDARQLIGGFGTGGPGTFNLQMVHTISDRAVASLTCDAPAKWRAAAASIIAIRVGEARGRTSPADEQPSDRLPGEAEVLHGLGHAGVGRISVVVERDDGARRQPASHAW